VFASGAEEQLAELAPGAVRELAVARFTAPEVATPRESRLRATIALGGASASNGWPLWIFPRTAWPGVDRISIVDPPGRLADLVPLLETHIVDPAEAEVVVATVWTPDVADIVGRGGRAVLLQPDGSGPLPVDAVPFWREAIRIAEPHPAWGDFPVEPFIGLQLRAASADHAFDTVERPGRRPILRRLDARTGQVHDYAAELPHGRGRMIATTLRLDGRTGDLPLGISRSPGALHLLGCWVRYLSSS
jgi:hypothetical protein